MAGFDVEERFGPCRASSPWWPVEILQRSLRFPRLLSLAWLGALVSLVVRAFRHGRIKLALTQPAQERTAACKLPGKTPRPSLPLPVLAAARVLWLSPAP